MAQIEMKQAAGCFLVGSIVGAAIALLYAPQSGARTTRDIRKFACKTVNRIDDLQVDIRDQVSDWVDDVTAAVQDGIDRGKILGADGCKQVLQGFDNARACIEGGRSRVERLIKTA